MLKKYLLWVGIFLLSAAVGFFGAGLLTKPADKPLAEKVEPVEPEGQKVEVVEEVPEEKPLTPVVLGQMQPVYNAKTKTYSLPVKVESAPEGAVLSLELYAYPDTTTLVLSSSTLPDTILNLAPAESGIYRVVVNAKVGDRSAKSGVRDVEGFVKVAAQVQKMSAGELQKQLNSKSRRISSDPRISRSALIHCSGLQGDDPAPQVLSDVITKLTMEIWSSVTVTSVSYNDNGIITAISLVPHYPY